MYSVEPATPEGALVRAARKRKRLTLAEGAALLGMGETKLGYIERGLGKGRVPYEYDDADLADIAGKLGIPAEELAAVGRTEAAGILRDTPPAQPEPAGDALWDDLFDALTTDSPDREVRDRAVLRHMWYGSFDSEGRLMPVADRVRMVTGWARRPLPGEAENARDTG